MGGKPRQKSTDVALARVGLLACARNYAADDCIANACELQDAAILYAAATKAAGCYHLADSDRPSPSLEEAPCPRCGLYYVEDGE